MTISIGVDSFAGEWKSCILNQGHLMELHTFPSSDEMATYLGQMCALYPEPTLVVSLDAAVPFGSLQELGEESLAAGMGGHSIPSAISELHSILAELRGLSLHSYYAPSVAYLPAVPLFRRLLRPELGSAHDVCAAIALLHHMHTQGAAWSEMNFFSINASRKRTSVLVLKDGQIINGIGTLLGSGRSAAQSNPGLDSTLLHEENSSTLLQQAWQEAFWEGLNEELAGLIAIHHLEDIVVLGKESSRLIERLAETYQVYLFPHAQADQEGYEAALGAALLAEGLEQSGNAAELIHYLQIRQALPLKHSSVSSSH